MAPKFSSACSVCSATPSQITPVWGSIPTVPSRRRIRWRRSPGCRDQAPQGHSRRDAASVHPNVLPKRQVGWGTGTVVGSSGHCPGQRGAPSACLGPMIPAPFPTFRTSRQWLRFVTSSWGGRAVTHRRQTLAVLAGFLLAAAWASGASGAPASHTTQRQVVIDSTNYQSEEQLLANTQVMVVARVASVGIDRSAPASQPASLVTLKVDDVLRGHVGRTARCPRNPRPDLKRVQWFSCRFPWRPLHTCCCSPEAPGAGGLLPGRRERREFAYNDTTPAIHKAGHFGGVEDS